MMNRLFLMIALLTLVNPSTLSSQTLSPLTGEMSYEASDNEDRILIDTGELEVHASDEAESLVPIPGGLYGTDGYNLFLIDKTTGNASLIGPHTNVITTIGAIAFDSNGILYGITIGGLPRLYQINPTNGNGSEIGPLNLTFLFEGGLAFNPSGLLLGADEGNANAANTVAIDSMTGAATIIGPSESRDLNGMTFGDCQFFAIDRPSNTLGTLDPITGAYTVIGNTVATVGDTGGLAFDPADGSLYATFSDTGGFYRVNKMTGEATLIAINDVIYGLAFAPGELIFADGFESGDTSCWM